MERNLSNKEAFTWICGNCTGVDLNTIIENDIIKTANYWNELGGVCSEKMVQAAIKGLKEFQEEL